MRRGHLNGRAAARLAQLAGGDGGGGWLANRGEVAAVAVAVVYVDMAGNRIGSGWKRWPRRNRRTGFLRQHCVVARGM